MSTGGSGPGGERGTAASGAAAGIDAETLERLRRSGIRIDREGELIHEGESIRHEGLRRAIFRWLDRLPPPDGRHILRLDERRFVYIDVDDTPLVVRAARLAGERVVLALSDGAEEALAPETLTIDGDGVLRCRVRDGRLEARLSTSSVAALADLFDEASERAAPGRGQGPRLRLGGRVFAIPARSAARP